MICRVAQPEVSQGIKTCFSPSSSNFLGISNFLTRNTTVLTLICISFFRQATRDLQWCIHGFFTYIAYTSRLCSGDEIQTCMTTCQHKMLTILISKSPIYLLFCLGFFWICSLKDHNDYTTYRSYMQTCMDPENPSGFVNLVFIFFASIFSSSQWMK